MSWLTDWLVIINVDCNFNPIKMHNSSKSRIDELWEALRALNWKTNGDPRIEIGTEQGIKE